MSVHLKKFYAVLQANHGGETDTATILGVYLSREAAEKAANDSDPAVPAHFKPARYFVVSLDGVELEPEAQPKPEVMAEADAVEPAAIEAKEEAEPKHKKGLFHR